MRVLIVPMAALAETGGPSGRCRLLAEGFREAGIEAATCMAEDVNFRKIDDVDNYFLDVPMPLGMPAFIAKKAFPFAQKMGITSRKSVNSFDQVLHITGNLDYGYLKKSVESIRQAINDFRPDFLYSEFNISALIAAKLENVRLCAAVSYPTQYEYSHNDSLAGGLNRLLKEESLPVVRSALDLFDLADVKFCPSIYELEPIEGKNVIFCGTLKSSAAGMAGCAEVSEQEHQRNRILVYMGNGTIPAAKMEDVVTDAFAESKYEVHVASAYLDPKDSGNIHIARRLDFDKLLDEAALFINHGGQNSVIDGLLHGVPQIMVPGKVFERKYNAKSVAVNGAGLVMQPDDFEPAMLRAAAEDLIGAGKYKSNAAALGEKLLSAGGIQTIARSLASSEEMTARAGE